MPDAELEMVINNLSNGDRKAAIDAYKSQMRAHFRNKLERDNDNEKAILKHWGYAHNYAFDILHTRWPAFEKVMRETEPRVDSLRARSAYNYAKSIAGERMPEVEKHIVTDALAAVDYAKNVLGRAWNSDDEYGDIANETISRHPTALYTYETEVPRGRGIGM